PVNSDYETHSSHSSFNARVAREFRVELRLLRCLNDAHMRPTERRRVCESRNANRTSDQYGDDEATAHRRHLTVKLRDRTTTRDKRRGRTLSPGARGAKPKARHGPLQRLLCGWLTI